MRRISFLALVTLWALPASALVIEQPLPNPAQEAVAQAAFHGLKCVVCEGQALAESDAALALQMRAQIRTMAESGKSEAEILAYFRARYGTNILMTPPIERSTALLWLAPALLLIGGGVVIARATKGTA